MRATAKALNADCHARPKRHQVFHKPSIYQRITEEICARIKTVMPRSDAFPSYCTGLSPLRLYQLNSVVLTLINIYQYPGYGTPGTVKGGCWCCRTVTKKSDMQNILKNISDKGQGAPPRVMAPDSAPYIRTTWLKLKKKYLNRLSLLSTSKSVTTQKYKTGGLFYFFLICLDVRS